MDPTRFSALRADIRNLDRIIDDAIQIYEQESYQGFLEDITVNNKSFGQVKVATGLASKEPIGVLKNAGGERISDYGGKAEVLADYVQGMLRPMNEHVDQSFHSSISLAVEKLDDRSPLETFSNAFRADGSTVESVERWNVAGFFKPSCISKAIAHRPNKKSSGLDEIPHTAMKTAGSVIFGFLSIIFYHCFNLGFFPKAWKEAMAVPILKRRVSSDECGSYRSISLFTAFGKLYEYFTLKHLRILVEHKDSQFGFRWGHSRSHVGQSFHRSISIAVEELGDRSPLETFADAFRADGSTVEIVERWNVAGFIKPSCISKANAHGPNKKSSGLDGIPHTALNNAGSVIFGFLSILFNHCINLCYSPKAWNEAMAVPILKRGAPSDECGSYRPISLLSAFGKLYEYFILKRLRILVEHKDSQFGFRWGHSTSLALSVFSTYIVKAF
ncbi:uncharacterized protein [Musca autumnalis]|uniref:uncharacterized protein n=1 Tax=Musca autumnalis TaxID=221902 RepID=UPI003CF9E384